jgi:hypothetical protein
LFRFDRRRWWVFGIVLAQFYFFTFVGGWFIAVPVLGELLFLTALMLFLLPGIVFAWTGLFEFHEFGAAPLGWPGYLVMIAFYAALALLISWPFRAKPPGPGPSPPTG